MQTNGDQHQAYVLPNCDFRQTCQFSFLAHPTIKNIITNMVDVELDVKERILRIIESTMIETRLNKN